MKFASKIDVQIIVNYVIDFSYDNLKAMILQIFYRFFIKSTHFALWISHLNKRRVS